VLPLLRADARLPRLLLLLLLPVVLLLLVVVSHRMCVP
jgi:hypothetical protein